jgi:hypothetical protein
MREGDLVEILLSSCLYPEACPISGTDFDFKSCNGHQGRIIQMKDNIVTKIAFKTRYMDCRFARIQLKLIGENVMEIAKRFIEDHDDFYNEH